MANGSLHTCSKNQQPQQSGLLKPILSKPLKTEKIQPDTANGTYVKTAVGVSDSYHQQPQQSGLL